MNAFEKRISLEDIKPGVVVWPVISVTGSVAAVMAMSEFASEPYKGEQLPDSFRFDWHPERAYFGNFANDANVKGAETGKQYNFHAFFLNEEDAKAYAEMINNDELPDDLKALRDELVKKAQARRDEEDDWW